ncbi:MAG: gamma carbonic anhydrase family protein [Spongiibacteraceae bacterium]|jgi:carbonic anhydrase/acetyltransferase-like protein (isoleucine patch superfamily)|nr:gamma carbonic anhydrase family protein [Spongiibacteraceae bacterium]
MRHYTPLSVRTLEEHTPRLGARVLIDPTAVVIGDVTMGDDSSVFPHVVIRGDVHRVVIGSRTNVQDGAVLHVTHVGDPRDPAGHPLLIGDDVTIGHKAILHGCTIGNRVLVGMGAVLMDGVVVEDDVMIAANALIPPGKRLERGWLYKGTAQQARPLTEAELGGLRYSASLYIGIKDRHIAALEKMAAGD